MDDSNYDPHITPSRPSTTNALYLALDLTSSIPPSDPPADPSTLPHLLSSTLSVPFDHCVFPLSPPGLVPSVASLLPLSFPSSTFTDSFIAVVPRLLAVTLTSPMSTPSAVRLAASQLSHCYAYYQHLGLTQVLLLFPDPPVASFCPHHLSQALSSALLSHPFLHTSLALPLTASSLSFYHGLLHALDHPQRLTLSLLLSPTLPHPHLLSRVKGDQLRLVLLSTDCFVTNNRGCPILPPTHRRVLLELLEHCHTVVLSPTSPVLPGSLVLHQHYLHHVAGGVRDGEGLHPRSYRDFLQAPLQPLHDDLDNQTYEVFEKDPVKYRLYQQAIALALRDRTRGQTVRVWVVGAGRGPLVDGALAAAREAGVDVAVTAFEKNVHALYTLHALRSTRWATTTPAVRVVPANILHWTPAADDDRCDVMVSELLGSFGDNELSPECLDCACRWLADGGVCIPERSVGWVVPVRDEGVAALLMGGGGVGGKAGKESGYVVDLHGFERVSEEDGRVAFVFAHPARPDKGPEDDEESALISQEEERESRRVRLVQGAPLPTDDEEEAAYLSSIRLARPPLTPSSPPLPAFSPLPMPSPNARCRELTFTVRACEDCPLTVPTVVTGLACYFHARLYRHVQLSTYPPTASPGMGSWFALYLPLRTPLWVSEGGELRVRLWRVVGDARVWYEWQLEARMRDAMVSSTHIHNAGGSAASIAL